MDIELLKTWIGRTAEATDIITPRLVEEYQATFAPNLAPVASGEAPLGVHWCLSPAIAPAAALGPDGHPKRGGFLPPVPLPRRMWAGGWVETYAALPEAGQVTRRSVIKDVAVKQGRTGPLCFVAVQHEYVSANGLAIREQHDIVYRDAAQAAEKTVTPDIVARPSDLSWQVDASPTLLFRYSAMTFNGHRIHYDLPYVTQEEGYAGLVVHGPIQATLLLNMAASLIGAPPSRFIYRGQMPLISGDGLKVSGMRNDRGDASLWTEGSDGLVRMTAKSEKIADKVLFG